VTQAGAAVPGCTSAAPAASGTNDANTERIVVADAVRRRLVALRNCPTNSRTAAERSVGAIE
jgi:hypothetical protein